LHREVRVGQLAKPFQFPMLHDVLRTYLFA